jgi:accessory colonization factor AcfC
LEDLGFGYDNKFKQQVISMIELRKTGIFDALNKKNLSRFNELLKEGAGLAD